MGHHITVATCSLNQWALDWEGNTSRIIRSIEIAKAAGATLRVGPELEICGYGCLDHFLEQDIYLHCWEMLTRILENKLCHGILLDIGMPIIHRNCRYNCRVVALDGKILLIRPKIHLCNDGNYREMRFFTPWGRPRHVEEYYLPRIMQEAQGALKVPIGDAVISTADTCFGMETCEELFTPDSPHNHMGLNGVEIFSNSSGSHHSLRKLDVRISLVLEATRKSGGVYLYSNQQGCDGDRLYYDGCAMIVVNGELVAQGSQFSLNDVEVITGTIDIEEVRAYRCTASRGIQATHSPAYQRIETRFSLSSTNKKIPSTPSPRIAPKYHYPEQEIALGPASWLWDYLRRSKASGFLLPLSGGIDSCATAVIVFSMCRMVCEAISEGNEQVIEDVRRIQDKYGAREQLPKKPEELCSSILHTIYLGMEKQSSHETRSRAEKLAARIGSYHKDVNIDDIFDSQKSLLTKATGFEPLFLSQGGSTTSNLALQNIQARSRMVTSYFFAQLLPSIRGSNGSLLVLGSANVDECLRGYLTKYDCSSADINPIGSISKNDLKRFIVYAEEKFDLDILREFVEATPTAELIPIEEGKSIQSDEEEMGMTYGELSIFGTLRKQQKLGPYGMYSRLVHEWKDHLTPRQVGEKVKRFHHYYAINRHKMTVMTPAYHAEAYSPDDHRFDLRPFLYPPFYESWSFKKIDEDVARIERIL